MSSFGSPQHDFDNPRGGGGGGRWGKLFAQGDNPLFWSLPLMRVAGITVRVSLIYIIWMAMELTTTHNWQFKAWSIGSLFVIVLLHEFGHCIACRLVKGEASEIMMWMLGGLAFCRPPHRWRAALVTTVGGPLVNVMLVPVLAIAVVAVGLGTRPLLFNPFDLGQSIGELQFQTWWQFAVWATYVTNWLLLLFNLLLPMFPLDGARIVQELLWSRLGYRRSMNISTTVGLVTAVVVGLYALTAENYLLLGLAIFGGLTCYSQKQQLRFMEDSGDDWMDRAERESEATAKRRRKEAARQQAETTELDRILAKIKDKGMGSLSRSEETFLRRTTQQRKGS